MCTGNIFLEKMYVSDHFLISYIGKNIQIAETGDAYITPGNYSHEKKLSCQQALTEIDWSEMYMLSDSLSAFSLFYSRFSHKKNVWWLENHWYWYDHKGKRILELF